MTCVIQGRRDLTSGWSLYLSLTLCVDHLVSAIPVAWSHCIESGGGVGTKPRPSLEPFRPFRL